MGISAKVILDGPEEKIGEVERKIEEDTGKDLHNAAALVQKS